MKKWWMIRAGDDNELISIWKEKGIASIGWSKLKNPKQYSSKEEMLAKADDVYAESKPRSRSSWVSQLWRFSREIEKGDRVITYIKDTRHYMVGTVKEPHFFDVTIGDPSYPNNIKVSWEDVTLERDALPQAAKNSLGSVLTIFRVDDWSNEFEKLLKNPVYEKDDKEDEDEAESVITEDFVSKALVMVQDKVDKLDPWKMEELVGGLLEAMDYNVHVSPKGPDGGVDVLAYKDAFGFEEPIIKTQVKHRKSTSGSQEIQQLLGANPINANSLFVSTGGFTAQAKAVAKRNSVKLVDLEELVDLIAHWYEQMPNYIRALLPLQKMYIPE